jgi:hypothetical protein
MPRVRAVKVARCLLPVFIGLVSCAYSKPAVVPAVGFDGEARVLTASDEASRIGELHLGRPGSLRYTLPEPLRIPDSGALELEYEVSGPKDGAVVVVSIPGEPSWSLPPDAAFLGIPVQASGGVRYRFPIGGTVVSAISLESRPKNDPAAGRSGEASEALLRLKSLRVQERAYGYSFEDAVPLATPFVYRDPAENGIVLSIEPSPEYRPVTPVTVSAAAAAAGAVLSAGDTRYRHIGSPEGAASITFQDGALPPDPYPLRLESAEAPRSFIVASSVSTSFPEEPVAADPGLVLSYRQERWRDPRYEVFRWQRFPSILIFDTADYAVQERLFKRLAFFVEKAGFRGRLAEDKEIADLHGWNAHDYRAEDLAAFFETARKTGFPLNAEESELMRILLATGILKRGPSGGAYVPGHGALISISRESTDYLRTLFMVHEAYHGLFFLDSDFRRFSAEVYAGLPVESKNFLKAYFDSRRYDVGDEYLMVNELMAYCLQQPLELAPRYFGETLPVRLENDQRRKNALPPRGTGPLPYEILARDFSAAAAEFDAYVFKRWGTRAGRVALVYQISRTTAAR